MEDSSRSMRMVKVGGFFFTTGFLGMLGAAALDDANKAKKWLMALAVLTTVVGVVFGLVAAFLYPGDNRDRLWELQEPDRVRARLARKARLNQFAAHTRHLLAEGEALLNERSLEWTLYTTLVFKWSQTIAGTVTSLEAADLTGDVADFPPDLGSSYDSVAEFMRPRLAVLARLIAETEADP